MDFRWLVGVKKTNKGDGEDTMVLGEDALKILFPAKYVH